MTGLLQDRVIARETVIDARKNRAKVSAEARFDQPVDSLVAGTPSWASSQRHNIDAAVWNSGGDDDDMRSLLLGEFRIRDTGLIWVI
jgi:hypothetical protein